MSGRKRCVFCTAASMGLSLIFAGSAMAQDTTIALPYEQEAAWDEIALTNDDMVSTGVNVRMQANENSPVIGCMYHGGAAWIISRGDEWTEIYSGGLTGFVKNEYLVYGEDAKAAAESHGVEGVATTWDDVKLYSGADGGSDVLDSIEYGDSFILTQDEGHWLQVQRGADSTAYVSSDDVSRVLLLDTAVATDESYLDTEAAGDGSGADGSDDSDAGADDAWTDGTVEDDGAAEDWAGADETWIDGSADDTWMDGAAEDDGTAEDWTGADGSDAGADDSWTDGTAEDGGAAEDWTGTDETWTDGSADDTWTDGAAEDWTGTDDAWTDGSADDTWADTAAADSADYASSALADEGWSCYDEEAGIYYDADTGLYYDSGTGILYDAWWNPVSEGTAAVPASGTDSAGSSSGESYTEASSSVPAGGGESYYDEETGIYYDAGTGLYYDSGTGILYDAWWNPVNEEIAVPPTFNTDTGDASQAGDYTEDSGDYSEDAGNGTADPSSSGSADDTSLLAALIYCEAGNQSYDGMVAVGAVVMNRVSSPMFPNSIREVIYQSGQFTPASSGWLDSALASGVPSTCYDAAAAAMSGENPIGSALYFNTGSGKGVKLGDHQFY